MRWGSPMASTAARKRCDSTCASGEPHRTAVLLAFLGGLSQAELAEAIRRNIMNAGERMTGLGVERVDVVVHDVKLPKEDLAA